MRLVVLSAFVVTLIPCVFDRSKEPIEVLIPHQQVGQGLCKEMTYIPDSACDGPLGEFYWEDEGGTVYDYCCTLNPPHPECQHAIPSACERWGCDNDDCRFVEGRDFCCVR